MGYFISLLLLLGLLPVAVVSAQETPVGAVDSGVYPNLLAEWGVSQDEIDARIEAVWQQLFYGDDDTQRVYYPVGDDMAYIIDVANNDIRSEGMSYGMMIAVQMDKQAEFDRLWKWTKTYLYNADGPYQGYFAWHARTDGSKIDHNPASDGEIWFVTALFFAAGRWGNGEGIFDYQSEANAILRTMLHEDARGTSVTDLFDAETGLVVFVPMFGRNSSFSDPSYVTPHYYELWARWAAEDNDSWRRFAAEGRLFWQRAAHPETGLMPNYARFDGSPQPSGDYGEFFYADAWRCAMNVALDYSWFAADPWQVEQSNRLLAFFHDLGIGRYNSKFEVDGTPANPQHRAGGLIAMNAVAALAATDERRWDFVEEFWEMPTPVGQYRYYDGLLMMMALLQLSGNFRAYAPA